MANAKIVDIKGVQWELKDEVARNKIIELEQKKFVKITSKINEENIKMNLIEIDNEKFIQFHINALYWSGEIGEIIANFKNDFGLATTVRCVLGMDFSDISGRDTIALDIEYTGYIKAYPQTHNQFVGMYKAGHIYGDAFIRVTN